METVVVGAGQPAPTAAVSIERSAAAALAAVAVCWAGAALVVVTAGEVWGTTRAAQLLVDAVVGLSFAPMGALILRGRRADGGVRTLAWVLIGAGLASGLAACATAVALVAEEADPGVELLVQVQSWLWVPGFVPLLTLVPLLYPAGLLPGLVWRVAAWASVVGMVLLSAGVALYPDAFIGRVSIDKPVTSLRAAELLTMSAAVLLLPAALAGLVALVVRLRSSSGLERRQVVVLLVAAGVLALVTTAQGVVPSPADLVAQAVAVGLVPVAIGVAVTRHRLYELDTALCRTLVAVSLAACLAGIYLTVFALTRAVMPAGLGTALAAGVTGVAIQPLAKRLSEGVDRLFYGDRVDPYAVSKRLSSALSRPGLDVSEVPHAVCATVLEALRLGSAAVLVVVDGAERQLATAGEPTGARERFPLWHRGDQVGWLAVSPRPGEARVDPRDAEILTVIADQVAPSLAALQLHQQLQRSRESLVGAREEERLRLRRDLHDGLGATLAGLRLQVESAHALVGDPTAGRLLAAAGTGVTQAVAELRSITDGLRPPAIDELGLERALILLAERLGSDRLVVTAEVGDLAHLSPAVEVAAYRIASEALTNAVRHARASEVRLRAVLVGAALEVTVYDDGAGQRHATPPSEQGSGIGLTSMRQRAEEIGGSLEITSGRNGHGTLVRAELPRVAGLAS